jgi:hypothetical protein
MQIMYFYFDAPQYPKVETPHCRCRRKLEALGAGRILSCLLGKYRSGSGHSFVFFA